MRQLILLSLLLFLPAKASENYVYLHCKGRLVGDKTDLKTGKTVNKSHNHQVYMTLDESNSKIRIGQIGSTPDWIDAAYTANAIIARINKYNRYISTFKVDRNTGDYTYDHNSDFATYKASSYAEGICKKQVPSKF